MRKHKNIISLLVKFIYGNKYAVFFSLLAIVANSLLIQLNALVVKYVTDSAVAGNGKSIYIGVTCSALIAIGVIVINYSNGIVSNKINLEFIRMAKQKVFDSFIALDDGIVNTGEYLTVLNGDTSTLGRFFLTFIPNLLANLFETAMGMSLILYINTELSAIIFLFLPFIYVVSKYQSQKAVSYGEKEREISGKLADAVQNSFNSFLIIRGAGLRSIASSAFEKKHVEYRNSLFDISRNRINNQIFALVISSIQQTVVFLIGMLMVHDGILSLGSFIVINSFCLRLINISKYYAALPVEFGSFMASFDRIDPYLGFITKPICCYLDNSVCGQLYLSINEYEFHNGRIASFDCHSGDVIGIIGETGSGKTSFALELLRHNIVNTNIKRYIEPKNVYYIPSAPSLLSLLTLRENMMNEREDIRIEQALDEVGMLTRWQASGLDFDSDITSFARQLSSGEAQRIALCRLLLSNPKVIVFDEAFSHIDAPSAGEILQRVIQRFKNSTLILISHRESDYALCNQKINLNMCSNSNGSFLN